MNDVELLVKVDVFVVLHASFCCQYLGGMVKLNVMESYIGGALLLLLRE